MPPTRLLPHSQCAPLQITEAFEAEGFAADNVAYGMGGGLLQKVNRDTMSFATKLNHIVYKCVRCQRAPEPACTAPE
jgi:nicotinic acid phosphoribosyltransferase